MENEVTLNAKTIHWEREAIEKLLLADVRERRAARRWRIVRSLLWMLLFGALIWLLFSDALPTSTPATPHTAMVAIKGEIADEAECQRRIRPARAAQRHGRQGRAGAGAAHQLARRQLLGAGGAISDEIHRLRALHKKPVYAVVETAASAAYYIASAADKIYVDKASIVGSIGVLINGFGFVDTLDKLGIERRLLTAGENKGFLDPFSPQSEAHKQHAQTMLEQIHRQFIDVVKKGRGERLKETPEMFSGLFWTGEQSVVPAWPTTSAAWIQWRATW